MSSQIISENLYNLNIERAVLSTIVFEPVQYEDIAAQLKPEDFYHPFHQHLFVAMEDLFRGDQPIDEEFLREKLTKKNQFDEATFLDVVSVNPLSNVKEYCAELRKYTEKRKLIEIATKINRAILEQDNVAKAKDAILQLQTQTSDIAKIELSEVELKIKKNNEFKKRIYKLKNILNDDTLTPDERDVIEKEIAELEQKIDRPSFTSYADVRKHFKHKITSEDIEKAKEVNFIFDFVIENEITLIAAKPGTGKTFLSLILAQIFVKNKYVLYLDGDNSLTTLKNRKVDNLLKNYEKIDYVKGNRDELNQELNNLLNCTDLSDLVIFVDSGKNLIDGDRDKNKDVSKFFNKLKKLRDLGATIIVLHHTNKQTVSEIGKIEKYVYAGSAAWEEDSSNVLIMYKNANKNSLILNVHKGRIGLEEDKEFAYVINETDDFYELTKLDVNYAKEDENFDELKTAILDIINSAEKPLSKNQIFSLLKKQELIENNKDYFYYVLNLGLNRHWNFQKAEKGTAVYVIPVEFVEQKETVIEYQDEPLQTFTTTTTTATIPILRDSEKTKDLRQQRQVEPEPIIPPEIITAKLDLNEMPKF
ncbi:DnaB-like helicase N-terminal domain-containing protein [Hydrogenimonas thermophila]|uniref:DnaB-like helicase N-terminal domain-containing protein n=1 Tax=Hydrogenimonas thermophila TaxID=223786 RepID=UPI002937324A|nr:DnaB-like helicase N-terminal domain-containing protein [Hydrogenimonas thermophila]WOE70142.1 DnaB-like helicase N-terminal domain-containing protein [Hydrogenimonas thermophila]WOE72659.1 DnaB-like helicase N-terminal domain-containing protein [Hydrogenimonas thermophila]